MAHFIKKIEQINFGLMSPEDIRKMSVLTVEYPDNYGDDGFPIEKGLMDPRMGVIDPSWVCRTCGLKGGDCQGHFGSIELARPVIHVGFGDVIHKILRSTCNDCGRILLNDDKIEYYAQKISQAMDNKESINNILKNIYREAKRELMTLPENGKVVDSRYCCPHCGAPQEAISLDMPTTIRQGNYRLTPVEVRERLEKITDDDAYVLGVNPEVARPEWMVLTVLPVPPVTVRPSLILDNGYRTEDDLTHKLVDILRINQRLLENMEAGAPQLIVEDLWELLQYHVTTYFDNDASGVPPARHRSGRILKTLIQRLEGKDGRFRFNLSSKRVNFSARTVISPDPNISINEVGVPEMIAKEVTVPVYVNEWNIDELQTYIENGPEIYPGAEYVLSGNNKRRISKDSKKFILENLLPGTIVERHLIDGDIVLLNRQPSLHRMSMMAHEVRVLPYKTFRINPCVCSPYNADFDGDEMNMHILQTDESRAEAKSLMRVQEHILSPRFGGPIIGAIHDHISGAYLLTRDGIEFTEEEALQIIRKSHLEIPPLIKNQWVLKYDFKFDEESYIFKDKGEKWTGKELFSLLLPNDLNLSYSAEISKCPVVYPPEDASVVIKDGILVQGVIDESAYGSFSGKILDKIVKEYGPGRAKEFLDRSTDLAICGIMKTGITTSLNDEEIPEEAQDRINEHLNKKMGEVDMLVQSYEEGYLQALPGRSLEETLEMKIMQVLGEARDMSGSIAENYLTMGKQSPDDSYEHVMAVENHSVVMARTGARVSMLNLTQITACVGQQAVRGGRIERGYLNRTLPHFKKGEFGVKAKGFVHSSYKSGLDPIEFFFHAIGGRESLVSYAIRIAQSGYMQRRLVNALQDLSVDSKGIVKDNEGNVIQLMYGDDGVDPAKSDFGKPADLNKLVEEIRMSSKIEISMNDNTNSKKSVTLTSEQIDKLKIRLDYLKNRQNIILKELKSFIRETKMELKNIEEKYYDDELNQLLISCQNNYDKLLTFNAYASNINSLDNLSNEIRNQESFLKNSKRKFDRKIREIEKIKHKEVTDAISQYTDLFELVDNILNKKRNNFSRLYSKSYELIDKTNKLNELIDVKLLLRDLDIIKNNIDENLNSLDDFKYEIENIHVNYPFRYIKTNFDNQIKKLNHIKEEIDKLDSSKLENELKNKENEYDDFLDFENKLNDSGDTQELISKLKNTLKDPFLALKLPGINLQLLGKEITKDIVNGNISGVDVDFEEIIIFYHENKSNNVIDEKEFDVLISDLDLSQYDKSIVEECKQNIKEGFLSNKIPKNHVKIKFSHCLSKKEKEYSQLIELNQIKNNPDTPDIKVHLTQEQQNEIYESTEEKICSKNGLRGNVIDYVRKKMDVQMGKNRANAKNLFFSFNIDLKGSQEYDFRHEVDYLIDENIIRIEIIDEEFVNKIVKEFIKYGKIQMR